jgi:hypothetical protein
VVAYWKWIEGLGASKHIIVVAKMKLARLEARSLSQICEILLRIGVDKYNKDGHKYLQRVMIPPSGEDES